MFPSECRHAVWYDRVEKLEWLSYPTVKKNEDMFIHFDRIHQRDGQTPHDG